MSNWQRGVFASDNHGDMQDRKAVKAFSSFLGIWKPEIRIHGGDNWNFVPLRKKASEDERREAMGQDFKAGMGFFDLMRPTHFLRGNHDERLWDLAKHGQGIMQEYALSLIGKIQLKLDEFGTEMLPYDKRAGILRIGKLKAAHGYAHGVNAARRAALAYGSILVGHAHSIQTASIEGLDNRVGRVGGCLCQLDMEYSRATMASLVHRHGFIPFVINKRTGEYQVWQAESINGTWIFPSDVVEVR